MKPQRSTLWLIVAIVFAIAATVLLLSYMVTDPSNVIVNLGGDSGKNYFTLIYHSMYGHGAWFQGMNYPYGEHIIYADGQPIISILLSYAFHLSAHEALASMNLLIALSYVLAIIYTYKVLLRFGLKPFLAILFACLINLLSPQVMRLNAHFALAYLCLIPMLFYWSILYDDTKQRKWVLYIFLLGFILSFIHLYFGAIIFIWVAFYCLGCALFNKGRLKNRLRYAWPMLIMAAVLFLCIKIGLSVTDPVKDRPTYPFNSLEYVTHIKDIFSSPYSSVWQYVREKKVFTKVSEAGEGYTYVGIVTGCVLFISLMLIVAKKIKRKAGKAIAPTPVFLPIWLFIGFGSLLIAMGVPFIWHLEWLMDYTSIFRQFRSMGRFSWIFYYVATIYAAVLINTWYTKNIAKGNAVAGYSILLSCLALWSVDAGGYVKYTRAFIAHGITESNHFFYGKETTWPQYLADNHYNGADFQGVMLLPLFFYGSEKIWVGGDVSGPLSVGIGASVQLHLPIVDAMMSRSSWSVMEKQVKTAAGPYADKPMLRDLVSSKPFLLLVRDGKILDEDQQYLLSASNFIGHHFESSIYACYPKRIEANDKRNADSARSIARYLKEGTDTCIGDRVNWYTEHFNDVTSSDVLSGAGALPCISGSDSIVAAYHVLPSADGQLFELSSWFLLSNKDSRSPSVALQMIDSTGIIFRSDTVFTTSSNDNHRMWFRAGLYFDIPSRCNKIQVKIINEPRGCYIAMDELMLRPARAVIISKSKNGALMVNNHFLKKD